MRTLTAPEIFGNWATCLLPIREDESICFESLEKDVAYLARCGVSGVYTNGTSGEFNEQTESEFRRISETMAWICSEGGTAYQIGASHTSSITMLERVKFAATLEPGAIQLILPDWFPLNPAERVDFMKRAADAADGIGLVLYNPPHAKHVLTPSELGELQAEVPSLVGVKVAIGDEFWLEEIRRYCPSLSVFIPGHFLATGLAGGASGSYSNIACLNPRGAQEWYELALQDMPAAFKLESRVRSFLSGHILPFRTQGFCNAALDKLLAAVGGWSKAGTRMRKPYHGIDPAAANPIRAAAETEIPELLQPER